jgi:transposase
LWRIVEPLIPPQRKRPQGGGTRYVEDRAVFTAIVYVLTTGCAWRHLRAEFGKRASLAGSRACRSIPWRLLGLRPCPV